MGGVLEEICAHKRALIAVRKRTAPLAVLAEQAKAAEPPRGFRRALESAVERSRHGLIAEIKKASPSQGEIRPNFDPVAIARAYADGGASCLSVLTDQPYFQGKDEDLVCARAAVALPVLRKDFIVDAYQVVESRAIGADCILLILAILDDPLARDLSSLATDLGMDVLVEVHDRTELDRALALNAPMVGINNRNLKTMEVDLRTTEALAPLVPAAHLLIAESGLKTPAHLARMAAVGARCFLIGEALMRSPDVAAATRTLLRTD